MDALLRLLAMMLTLTLAIHCTVHVTVELLFPVAAHSALVVEILAVFTNVYHEARRLVRVQVRTIVPPLPAGRVQSANVVRGIVIPAGTMSVMVTLEAGLPPLFPYVNV